ncbi:MAG: NUDIX hydrolase [Deltaproteobacteria bacterium]|nr:NUDIX hydrolase [Deltaproteobacteria bacterium]
MTIEFKDQDDLLREERAALLIERRVKSKGRKILITEHDVVLPTGVSTTLDVIEHPGASAMVAIDDEGSVLLLRQYRYAVAEELWEVPAGTLDDDEKPLTCAKRELIEEAGVSAAKWTEMGHVVTVPGFCNERIFLFLAEGLKSQHAEHDDDEVIYEVKAFAWSDVFDMVRDGRLSDAKSLAALWRAHLVLQQRTL